MVSAFGEVRNAWNQEHITGGSSGGSATAVAAGLGYGAIGTDTAGSVREPSALCGVVGLKPTYGRVSARGVIPLSVSLDHVGPIGRTVADVAAILAAIAGYDAADKASVDAPVEDYVAALGKISSRCESACRRNSFSKIWTRKWPPRSITRFPAWLRWALKSAILNCQCRPTGPCKARESYAFHAEFVAPQSGTLPAGNPAPDSYRSECQPGCPARMPPRTGTGAPRDHLCFCGCGCAGHADHADCGADDCRTETESRPSAAAGTAVAAKYSSRSTFGDCRRFQSLADSPKPACPSACRSSGRTGEKRESCRSPTRTSRRQHGTSASRCHPERRIRCLAKIAKRFLKTSFEFSVSLSSKRL